MTKKERKQFAGILLGIARSDTDETIDTVASSLLAYGWDDRYSHKYLVERVLPDLVSELSLDATPDTATRLFDAMVEDYENFSQVQVVWYPIVNLRVTETLNIGGITVRELDDAAIDEAETRLAAVLAGSADDELAKASMMDIYREWWGKLKGSTVAEIRVTARKEIAKQRARERYDELLDFLNGAATLLSPMDHRIRVGAPGELAPGLEVVLIISDPPEAFAMPSTRVGPLYHLDLTTERLEKLRDTGYWGYADLLGVTPSERTNFEEALLLALHWYADSGRHQLPANQLLSLTIAAETLFPRERGAIGVYCAEGLAFVLGSSADRRRAIRRKFLALYGQRGDVAHTGRLRVTADDVYALANLVMGAMIALVGRRSEFKTTADLDRWVDDQRLTGPTDLATTEPNDPA